MGPAALLIRSVRKRGLLRTVRLVASELAFDWLHGTKTRGVVPVAGLNLASDANRRFAEQYQPANPVIVRAALAKLREAGVDLARSTLVDLGSGKGRAMILALEAGVGRVVGVEFSPDLCSAAALNLAVLERAQKVRGGTFQIVCADVSDYAWPPEADIFFLFNPFGREVVDRVAERIAQQARDAQREAIVVYLNPLVPGAFESAGFGEYVREGMDYLILRFSPAS